MLPLSAKESAAQGSFESNKMRQCVFDTVDASVLEFYNKRIVADGVLKPAAVRNWIAESGTSEEHILELSKIEIHS